MYDLTEVGIAQSSLADAKQSISRWLRDDPCAPRLTDAETLLMSQASNNGDSVH